MKYAIALPLLESEQNIVIKHMGRPSQNKKAIERQWNYINEREVNGINNDITKKTGVLKNSLNAELKNDVYSLVKSGVGSQKLSSWCNESKVVYNIQVEIIVNLCIIYHG